MSYTSNKAAGRENPASDRISDEAGSTVANSNQQRFTTPASSKIRTVSVDGGKFNTGNQVRIQKSTKGLDRVGVESTVALAGRTKVSPAVENPDGQRNRPGTSRK